MDAEKRYLPLPDGHGSKKWLLILKQFLNRAHRQAATRSAFSAGCWMD
jgi:hypothetical protein